MKICVWWTSLYNLKSFSWQKQLDNKTIKILQRFCHAHVLVIKPNKICKKSGTVKFSILNRASWPPIFFILTHMAKPLRDTMTQCSKESKTRCWEKEQFKSSSRQPTGNVEKKLKLKKHARAMLVRNIDVSDRLLKGALVTVLKLKIVSQKEIETVYIKFDNCNIGKILLASTKNSFALRLYFREFWFGQLSFINYKSLPCEKWL